MKAEETRGKEGIFRKVTKRNIDIEDSVTVGEQWDKVEKAMTEVADTVCDGFYITHSPFSWG